MHPNLLTGFLKNPESEIRLENKFGSGVGAEVGGVGLGVGHAVGATVAPGPQYSWLWYHV